MQNDGNEQLRIHTVDLIRRWMLFNNYRYEVQYVGYWSGRYYDWRTVCIQVDFSKVPEEFIDYKVQTARRMTARNNST